MKKEDIDYSKLLKDIDLNIYPECPQHLIREDGTEGIICDREGLQYIVAEPFVRVVEYLYDLNVQTVSCGENGNNKIGITFNYDAFDQRNKQIVDLYLKQKGEKIIKPTEQRNHSRFRLEVDVDMETDTVSTAEKKLVREIKKLGLVKQDVLFGIKSKQSVIKHFMEVYSERTIVKKGNVTEIVMVPTLTEKEVLDMLIEDGRVIDGNIVWDSEELYQKHLDYLRELNRKPRPV